MATRQMFNAQHWLGEALEAYLRGWQEHSWSNTGMWGSGISISSSSLSGPGADSECGEIVGEA